MSTLQPSHGPSGPARPQPAEPTVSYVLVHSGSDPAGSSAPTPSVPGLGLCGPGWTVLAAHGSRWSWSIRLDAHGAAYAAPTFAQGGGGPVDAAVKAAYDRFKTLQEGKNADYIPALAKVDPNLFGIAVVTPDGKVYTAGDIKTEVSIQSISKVFTMAQVIQEQGLESIEKRIGVDATGARFNSIIAIEGVKPSSAPARQK